MLPVALVPVLLVAGQSRPATVDPKDLPDERVYPLFLHLMRSAPPPHWDFEAKVNYLKPSGFSRPEVSRIVQAADRYFSLFEPIDRELKAIYKGLRDRGEMIPEPETVATPYVQKRANALNTVLNDLRRDLGAVASSKLDAHMERVKSHTKVVVPPSKAMHAGH